MTNEQMVCGRDTGQRHKLVSAQSLNCSFLFDMAGNGLFGGILTSDKNKTKHGMRFIPTQNALDGHEFLKFIKIV